MSNLDLAIKKYNLKNSTEELIKGLQLKTDLYLGQNEYPLFQEYMMNLIKIKSNNELVEQLKIFDSSLNTFIHSIDKTMTHLSKSLEDFSKKTSETSSTLNFLTGVLALATITQVIVTAINTFYK